ncbi:MAG: hypothetical protein J7K26_00575 [Candidatus Aenigmarchaeota archaeon]|nr:hypothetical protein [Candidatus Aenigmarchaeota archaeon]
MKKIIIFFIFLLLLTQIYAVTNYKELMFFLDPGDFLEMRLGINNYLNKSLNVSIQLEGDTEIIELEKNICYLEPGEKQTIAVTLSIPEDYKKSSYSVTINAISQPDNKIIKQYRIKVSTFNTTSASVFIIENIFHVCIVLIILLLFYLIIYKKFRV